MRITTWLVPLTIAGLLWACSPAESPRQMEMVYSGNLNGELEPCGCSEQGNLGGIKRRATLVGKWRGENPELVFISSGGLLTSDTERDKLKSLYILRGFQHLAYDAVGVQWRDLAYGAAFLKATPLNWVNSNWLEPDFKKSLLIKKQGVTMAVFSWLDPAASPWRKMQGDKRKVADKTGDLQTLMRSAKKRGQTVVLLTSQPLAALKKLFDLSVVDVLLIESNHETFKAPLRDGATLVLQAGSRGMRLGKLRLTLDRQGSIKAFKHEVVDMPEAVADDPALANWYQEYNDRVKQAYLKKVELRKAQQTGESEYVGAEGCAFCHKAIYESWEKSKHARAFEALENVNKAFDPDCITCHTVGFNEKGGFVDTGSTADLVNVQCENCHGPARAHAKSGGKESLKKIKGEGDKVCKTCHNAAHSPAFKFEAYWPRIMHKK